MRPAGAEITAEDFLAVPGIGWQGAYLGEDTLLIAGESVWVSWRSTPDKSLVRHRAPRSLQVGCGRQQHLEWPVQWDG